MKISAPRDNHIVLTPRRKLRFAATQGGFEAHARPRLSPSRSRHALAGTGFEPVGPVIELSQIHYKPLKVSRAKVRSGAVPNLPVTSALLTVEQLDSREEHLVLLEVDPKSGQIFDWTFPTPAPPPPLVTSRARALHPRLSTVSFEVSLHSAGRTSRVKFGAKTLSLLPSLGLRKFLRFFSLPTRLLRAAEEEIERELGHLLQPLATYADRKILKLDEGLKFFDQEFHLSPVTASDLPAMNGRRVLLFVHGIISSTKEAFRELIRTPAGSAASFHTRLENFYGKDRLLAYDHFTLSKTTIENAADLARQLPPGAKIDILCHSRGAGVVRALLELTPEKLPPGVEFNVRGIEFNEVCFVAGACLGSDLAEQEAVHRLFKAVHHALLITGAGLEARIIALGLMLVLRGLQELPGTLSMLPSGDIIKRINSAGPSLAKRYSYIRANFDPSNTALAVINHELIDRIFFNNHLNDVIVPFEGAGPQATYAPATPKNLAHEFNTGGAVQTDVWHTHFFENSVTQDAIAKVLDLK